METTVKKVKKKKKKKEKKIKKQLILDPWSSSNLDITKLIPSKISLNAPISKPISKPMKSPIGKKQSFVFFLFLQLRNKNRFILKITHHICSNMSMKIKTCCHKKTI